MKQDFERNCLKNPLKPLKSCFKLGEKSRLGLALAVLNSWAKTNHFKMNILSQRLHCNNICDLAWKKKEISYYNTSYACVKKIARNFNRNFKFLWSFIWSHNCGRRTATQPTNYSRCLLKRICMSSLIFATSKSAVFIVLAQNNQFCYNVYKGCCENCLTFRQPNCFSNNVKSHSKIFWMRFKLLFKINAKLRKKNS